MSNLESVLQKFLSEKGSEFESLSEKYDIPEAFRKYNNLPDFTKIVKYYKMMYAFCMKYRPTNVLEIGTQTGACAALMSEGARQVVCVDVDTKFIPGKIRERKNISIVQFSNPEDFMVMNFNSFDMIFVDMGHDGLLEASLYHNLRFNGYTGFVFWDDINLNDKMRIFWKAIETEKYELDWHSYEDCGFGLTVFR